MPCTPAWSLASPLDLAQALSAARQTVYHDADYQNFGLCRLNKAQRHKAHYLRQVLFDLLELTKALPAAIQFLQQSSNTVSAAKQ